MLNFIEPFEVYVDGKKFDNVFGFIVTCDRSNSGEDPQKNMVTLYYRNSENEHPRTVTLELGGVSFAPIKSNA